MPPVDDAPGLHGVEPLPPEWLRWWAWALAAAGVLLACGAGGALLGEVVRQHRLGALRADVRAAEGAGPAALRAALPELNRRRAPFSENLEARFLLSGLYLRAAALLPSRRAYLDQALREIEAARALLPDPAAEPRLAFGLAMQRSLCLMEIGGGANEREALRELQRAGELLSALPGAMREVQEDIWKNAMAYLLASAEDGAVRDPERALGLIREVVAAFPNSEEPAYLDTLAEAYYRTGRPALALRVQRTALALADAEGLEVYLKHYDAYRAAAAPSDPQRGEDF